MQVLVCANFVDAAEIQYLGGLKCPSDAAEISWRIQVLILP